MTYKPTIIVAGAGGGKGGSASGATEAPNSLRSKQIAHIIDLLGEGEWEGLIDGPAGIYLNDVALFTPTSPTGDVVSIDETSSETGVWGPAGVWNFKGITLEFRNGTQSQTAIRAASSASFVQSVALQVVHATPIVASITNPNVDLAVVNVQVNQLYQQDTSNGNISGYYVDVEVQVRHGAGAWTSVKTDRIEGKAMSAYVRSYAVDLHTVSTSGPWDVRVLRTSEDDPDSSKHSETVFVGMDLMSRDKFRYPNSALCSIGIDASQLGSIPSRAYDCKMSRIRVPTNYTPSTRAYAGVWDGTFKVAWSDNPAWCLYDMITSKRYGLGEYVDEALTDKWALYTIGQYCDELVPDGFGGTEPRFRLNVFLQTSTEAITLVQNLASVFRGILYYLNESLTALQDSPSDSVYQFNPSNVVDGLFNYAGASGSTRHTVAQVVWNNPEISYKQDLEAVEDPAGLLRFGYRPVVVQAMGCTSRGQAHRLGAWTLYVEQYEADIINFSTSLEGTGVQPGNIIDVYDPTRANIRLGGRVLSVVEQTIVIDKDVTLPGGTHSFSFISDTGELVTRSLTYAGTSDTLTLDASGEVPSVGSIFGIQTASVMAQQFRILSITESDKHKYDISAVAYNVSKYAYVEDGLKLTTRPIRLQDGVLDAPANVVFTENLYLLADGSICNSLTASWDQDPMAVGYMLSYRINSGNWSTEQLFTSHEATLSSAVAGWIVGLRLTAMFVGNIRGIQTELAYTVLGERFPPPPFDYLSVDVAPDGTRQISYGYTSTPKPLDYLGAEIRFFVGDTSDWSAMTPLGDGFYTYSPVETVAHPAPGVYTVAVCAEDMTHVLSTPIFYTVDLTIGTTDITTITDAIHRIDDIASDNVLSMGEKRANGILWNDIVAFYGANVPAATAVDLIEERDAFVLAYNNLLAYLEAPYDSVSGFGVGLGGTDWEDASTDSVINGTVFRAKFDALFSAAEVLVAALTGNAQATADTAVASIAEATTRIDVIASDNVLSMGEKRSNQVFYNQIVSFHDVIVAEATAAGITTELTNFTDAYTELGVYLGAVYDAGTGQGVGAGGADWRDVTTDSVINGTVFRAKFDAVFDTGQILQARLTSLAQTTADTAVASIEEASTRIDDISDDNILSMGEKSSNQVFYNQIVSYHDAKVAQATALGITTELTAFSAAYTALGTYLTAAYNTGTGQGVGTGGTDWSDVSTNSIINGVVFREKFQAVFDTAQVLDARMTAVAQTAAEQGISDAADAQFVADSAYSSVADYVAAANASIAQTASDSVLSSYEKAKIVRAKADIITWQGALAGRITTYSAAYPTTPISRTAFDNAVTALTTYLTAVFNSGTGQGVGSGGTDWSNTSTNSNINGATFRSKFSAVYTEASALDSQLALTSPVTSFLSTDAPIVLAGSAAQLSANTAATAAANAAADAATKLSKSSSDILSGAISVTSAGGFKTGTITWNGSGVLTSGSGVAMTAKGIVAANGGVATFTLDGTTGAATFKGDIFGASNIAITGTATFDGITTIAGKNFAGVFNSALGSAHGVAGYAAGGEGVYGEAAGGTGVYGLATGAGKGVIGTTGHVNGVGVFAENGLGGTALYVNGRVEFQAAGSTGAATATFPGNNKPGSISTNLWIPVRVNGVNGWMPWWSN